MIQWDMAPKDRGPTDGAHPKTLDQIGRKGWKRSEDKRLEENKLKYLYRANSSTLHAVICRIQQEQRCVMS